MRVDFEFTAEEAAEFQLDSQKSSKEGASWRRREQLKFAVSLVFVALTIYFVAGPDRSGITPPVAILLVAAIALLLVIPFGWYYDGLVRKRIRRLVVEKMGGEGPHVCSIEIRPESLWVAHPGVEMAFPWRDATGVTERNDGILVTFAGARVLARSRAFRTALEREEFLRLARNHADATRRDFARECRR